MCINESFIFLQVHAAPHVAVLSTGDEVADPSTPHLRPGAIRDANRPMLLAAAADAGATTMDLVRDSLLLPGTRHPWQRRLLACLPACLPRQSGSAMKGLPQSHVAELTGCCCSQGIVPDSAGVEGLEAVLQDALDAGADMLITSGAC